MTEALKRSLELARLELLDMGLRGNTLLNLRQSTATLPVIDEISAQVYRILVEEQKSMTFLPVPEQGEDDSEENEDRIPLPQLLEELYGEERHTDTRLQTRLAAEPLDRRLLKISNEARTYYEEQGVEILYLALGFLVWFEDVNSSTERRAPLVLIPVELKRATASDRFKLAYTEADIGPNLTLAAKLKSEFRVILPDFPEELDLDDYFAEMEERITNLPRWRVDPNAISLGFFSFGKFQMYQDLDSANWPEGEKPCNHPILKAILGEGFSSEIQSRVSHNGGGNESLPSLVELNFVKDADSSQTMAAMAVKSGKNLVIQGPPGTGKSQTITNIIAELLGDKKRVLFVAEKMAALEVVKRRLDECHLGEAVLELHSHKSNRKAVLDELQRTLDLGMPQVPDRHYEREKHQKTQEQLDNYCEAVNTPILASGVSYVEALGRHLNLSNQINEHNLPSIDFDLLRNWTDQEFTHACDRLHQLIAHLNEMGPPVDNPFRSTRLKDFSPIKQADLVSKLNSAEGLIRQCQQEVAYIADAMELPLPVSLGDIYTLHRAATRAYQAPHIAGLKLTTDDWQQRRDRIKILLDSGSTLQQLRRKHDNCLIDQAWTVDVLPMRAAWVSTGHKWWRFLSSDFRKAKRDLQGLMKEDLPSQASDCLATIDDILGYQTALAQYQKHEQLGATLFGAQWQGLESDWTVLTSLSDWVIDLYQEVTAGNIPPAILRFLEGGPELEGWAAKLSKISADAMRLEGLIGDIVNLIELELPGGPDITPATVSLIKLAQSIAVWRDRVDDLYAMTRYNVIRGTFDSAALKGIADMSFDWNRDPQMLLTTLQASWYAGLLEEAYSNRDSIRYFDRIGQEKAIDDFRNLDRALFTHAQESLVRQLHQNLPSKNAPGEMALLRKEMNKKRRHMPLRRMIKQAGRAMQQIKPVFMMSPMSVATYLEQGAVQFDVVIFDEASQVKVVDAMGSLLRGRQAVVVGDTKQMPPTDFFSMALELDDEEAQESQTADVESILGMFLAQGAQEAMLRWHYRSRHDSLISVSNQEFYDGKLMIFPSPGVNPSASGLQFKYLPNTVYERGGSRTNREEAKAVAEAVMQHARKKPQFTLGVVAFSTAQRDCILLEVERLRREHPETESFFTTDRPDGESFFVKNLENVQGDERDMIYISIGYGRTSAGRVSQSFGPINRDGGERRLNVLITRARLGMDVFCNFTADDLNTSADTPFGVRALKNFLKFAQTGELESRHETGKDTDSPFEDEVISAIQRLGYQVEAQVGSAGFFIDIAVRDPNKPGRYALAVECDGASYHSSANARDRDRLRQDVLEGLGWQFHRIWSTDWFRNNQKETERLKQSIEHAVQRLKNYPLNGTPQVQNSVPTTAVKNSITRAENPEESMSLSEPYTPFSGDLGIPTNIDLHELRDHTIQQAIGKLLQAEGPIHIEQASRRLAESVGISRVGSRIAQRFQEAIEKGNTANVFHFQNSFLYPDRSRVVVIRDRSSLPSALKKIEYVPPEEMRAAILKTVKSAFSISRADVISEGLGLLGFQRSTQKAASSMEAVLNQLISIGVIVESDGFLSSTGPR